MSGIAPNPLNAISKVYLDQVAEAKVEPPKEKLNTDRNMFNIPKDEQQAAKERLLAKSAAKRKAAMEALDPVGQEDADIDNDGDTDKSDKYLHKRRKAIGKAMKKRMKEEKELSEVTKMGIHAPHEVPDKNLKGLVKKAVKRIDADNDGDVDKDDPKETGMGEFVPSPDGKKKVRTSVRTESFSNWRNDLTEVMDDSVDSKPIKEKKVNNKIKINPTLGEALEEIGATLIEMVEVDEFDFVVESVYDELLEEGYGEDDIEEAIEFALTEAKVTFGHDTPTKKDDVMKKAKGRLRYLGRKVGEKIGAAKKSAKYASAKAQVAAYNKGREVAQTAGDKTRKARKAVADAPGKAKKGLKGAVKKAAQKVVDRMSEETQIDENVATGKAKRAKFGGIAQKVGKSEVVTNKEKSAALEKHFAAKKAKEKSAGEAAHKAASAKGLSPAEAEMRRKAAERKAARMRKEETEIEEGIGMTMAKAVGNPPALSKRMKLKQALLNREIRKNAAASKKKSYSGAAASEKASKVDKYMSPAAKTTAKEEFEIDEEKKKLPYLKMYRKAGNLGRDGSPEAMERSKKITKVMNDDAKRRAYHRERDDAAKEAKRAKKMNKEEVENVDEIYMVSPQTKKSQDNPKKKETWYDRDERKRKSQKEEVEQIEELTDLQRRRYLGRKPGESKERLKRSNERKDKKAALAAMEKQYRGMKAGIYSSYEPKGEQLDEMPYQVMGSPDGGKEKNVGKPVKSRKYADARAAELADTHKATGGKYRSQYVEEIGIDESRYADVKPISVEPAPSRLRYDPKVKPISVEPAPSRLRYPENKTESKPKKSLKDRIKSALKKEEFVDEKLNMKKEKMGDVIKDFYKSDAPQFKGKSKEKRREMAIAAKLTAERGGKRLGEGATEMPMSPEELALQKKKTKIDLMISKRREQSLQKKKDI